MAANDKTRGNNYKIDLEIYVVFIIVIGISVFNAIYCSIYISKNQDSTTRIMTIDIPSLQSLENMNLLVTRSKMYTTNWVYLQGNREDKERLKILQTVEYPELKGNILALMTLWNDGENKDSIQSVFRDYEKLIASQRQIMALLDGFDDYEDPMKKFSAEEIVETSILPQTTRIMNNLNHVILRKKTTADLMHRHMLSSSRVLLWSVIGIAIMIVLVVLVAAFYMSNNILVPTMRLKNYILQMAKGENSEMRFRRRKNAIGQMTEAVSTLSENLRRTAHFAHTIGDGNFKAEHQPLGEKDELGNALIQMRESLRRADEENKQRNWINNGLAQVNQVLHDNTDNIDKLTDQFISTLVKYVGTLQGAVYLVGQNDFHNQQWIELHGHYALDKSAQVKKRLAIGEGLVGQAIKDGTPIYLKNAPQEFIRISSGSGDHPASHILIVPVKHHGVIYGAIEMASFTEFDPLIIRFIESIGETIASTLSSVKANTFTKELLEETKKQAERLYAQEEELRQTNEELSNQSKLLQTSEEELKESNLELKEQARELEHQNEILQQAREALSLKAKELEMNSRYKSEFLANMSHELRTPLNSVLILAKLLHENKLQNLTDKQKEYASVIHKSGTDLLVLINDILDLSKIEAGKFEMILENTEVKIVKDDLRNMFSEVANAKKIDFGFELHSNIPANIVTDRVRLEQVLKNLLSNAFKFTPEGGNVTLRIRMADPKTQLSNPRLLYSKGNIEISVSDSGIGIPEEKQQLIFEAFQQADGSTNRRYGGTGLGLSISKMLVALLGGEMKLISEHGKGSTFFVYLPLDMEVTASSPNSQYSPMEIARTKSPVNSPATAQYVPVPQVLPDDRDELQQGDKVLLIVEDDLSFARILLDMAHEKNFKAVVVNEGNSGWHYAQSVQPAAIILDMQLPGMDGWTLLKKFKENDKLSRIPIHVMSAMDRRQLGMEMGATAYLRKPLDKEDLDNAFRAIDETFLVRVKRVLLVENNSVQQEIVANLLGQQIDHVSIDHALTLEEALQKIREVNFDCILFDLDILGSPEEKIDALQKINAVAVDHQPHIILFTEKEINEEQEHRLRKYSETIVIRKGYSLERLMEETELFFHNLNATTSAAKQAPLIPKSMEGILTDRVVLIADDDMRNIYALSNVLEGEGMTLITATNGREALEKLKANPQVEIILMDIMMPEMDGYQAMQEIRKMDTFKHLPILALTAKAMSGDREKCLQNGASDYISKPVNPDQLLSLMRVWLYKS